MNYMSNKELIESLYLYNKHKKYKYEKRFFGNVNIMINEIIRENKFSGYTNLHNDMKANALYFITINLCKGNIKLKRLKNEKCCYIKTKLKLNKNQELIDKKNIDLESLHDILGKEVFIKKRLSNNKLIVSKIISKEKLNARHSKIETEDTEHLIDIYMIEFSNIFSYVTYIIEQSFWKIINNENKQKNLTQLIYNTSNRSQIDEIKTDLDFTSEYNRDKIEKMRLESIEVEKKKVDEMNGIITKRKKNIKLATNNIWGFNKK